MPLISIIIVHYHSPHCLDNLLESFYAISDSAVYEYELIIINNGGDITPRRHENIPLKIYETGTNLGFAKGLNYGISLSRGEVLFCMNSDLILHENCIVELVNGLKISPIVGPKFYLDKDCSWILPPADIERFIQNRNEMRPLYVTQSFRNYGKWWKRMRDLLEKDTYVHTYDLTGALLGFTKDAWNKVGEFDPNYQLYFEETDWLLRACKKGIRSTIIPQAKVTHFYNQSEIKNTKLDFWYQESALYFIKKHFSFGKRFISPFFQSFLEKINYNSNKNFWIRCKQKDESNFEPINLDYLVNLSFSDCYIQISITDSFMPSSIAKLTSNLESKSWACPPEIWEKLSPRQYYFRLVNEEGELLLPNEKLLN